MIRFFRIHLNLHLKRLSLRAQFAMTAATKNPAPAAPSVSAEPAQAVALTSEQTELIARVECYERLQTEVTSQLSTLRTKSTALEEDLFKQVCALTDLAAKGQLVQRLRSFETTSAPVAAELAVLERFSALVKRRHDEFLSTRCDVVALAYKRRIELLNAKHVKEQAEADAVKDEIRRLEARIHECGKHHREQKQLAKSAS